MRKEKSRDAARSRRGKENFEFYELAKMLPLPGAITTQLDKASIIRLTISFLKLKDFVAHGDPPWRRDGPTLKGGTLRSRSIVTDLFEQHQATHILQSLDGFAFALGADGRFLYVSETVSIYLGLSQVEMTGSTVFDYIHQQDQAELADAIGINVCHSPSATSPASVVSDEGSSSNPGTSTPTNFDRPPALMAVNNPSSTQCLRRSFCIRMKSTLTKRGCHFKSSGYRKDDGDSGDLLINEANEEITASSSFSNKKCQQLDILHANDSLPKVVLVLASLRPQYAFSTVRKTPPSIMGLVAVAIALPPPSVNELRLEQDMFVTRLTFDFRISHCEPRVSDLLEYTSEEITGRNMYSLCHAQDAEKLRKCHGDLIQKGQVVTGYYRLMSKNGGYVWLQSCATVICNTKNAEEETIICVNYVLSNIEYDHCIMDYAQLPSSRELRSEEPASSEKGSASPDKEGGRDNNSTTDADIDHPTPRSEHSESKEDDGENFAHTADHSDADGKQEQLQANSETSPCEASPTANFPGCTYLDADELDRLGVGANNNNSSNTSHIDTLEKSNDNDGLCSSRQRKRKHVDNESSKSPKSRPGSTTSSSLEVLSLDNGNYLPNENGEDQPLQLPGSADSLPPQLEQPNSVESNHNPSDKNDKSSNVSRPWTRSPVSVSSPLDPPYNSQHLPDDMAKNGTTAGNGMSVRELEDAMNRHLPHDSSSPTSPEVLMLKSYATASGGAPAPQHGHHPRQSIQWISGGAPAPLPATSLLRQIYVSRESVIRSGAHASRSSGSGCYGGDVHQGTLPTPPAGQGEPAYGDTAQLMLQSAAKLSAADAAAAYGVISGFASSGYVDTCNAMTPPSSVSPRDKFNSDATSAFNEAAAVAAAAAIPHMRHYVTADPNSLQHLPLKHPQLFVHPGNLDHHHHGSYGHAQQTLSPDQHQLYHHPSSFHLYHPTPGSSKPPLHATNGSSWFCQPHS